MPTQPLEHADTMVVLVPANTNVNPTGIFCRVASSEAIEDVILVPVPDILDHVPLLAKKL